jgi:hypothetical protein
VAITVGATSYAAIGLSGWIPEETMPMMLDALREAAEQIRILNLEDTRAFEPHDPAFDYRVAV